MSLADAFSKTGIYKVPITNGGIYRLRDSAVDFPVDDHRGTRTEHDFRTVVVLSCQSHCDDPDEEEVLIAPMSHTLTLSRLTDCQFKPNKENGLNAPGRILLSHIQPVPKIALEKMFGRFTDSEWETVCAHVLANIDR